MEISAAPASNARSMGSSIDNQKHDAAENAAHRSRETVAHLRKSDLYASYEAAFQAATGLPLALRAVGSLQSPLVEARNSSPFFRLLSLTNRTCSDYLRFQADVEAVSGTGAATREYSSGHVESMVPVRVGENIVAFLQTGHVMHRAPSPAAFRRMARQWRESGLSLPLAEIEKAYLGSRVVSKAQYGAMVGLLSIFAEHLSAVVNQLMTMKAKAELPAVAKARSFIEEHQTEEIALGDVARAVNMSAFYFCKIFRKVTGVTFVEYLARRRVEDVKKLLLDPHKRISEAAFEAGFQSLSQFNRVFRRIAGEAPTVYRDQLHGTQPATRQLVFAA